jgi:hypothetical protein
MARTPGKPPLSIVSTETTTFPPPCQLGRPGTRLWNSIQREYGIRDSGGIALLCQICLASDRLENLAAAIGRDGEVVYSRGGVPKAHPAIRDETALRGFIIRTLQKLGITTEPVKAPGRPAAEMGWIPQERT